MIEFQLAFGIFAPITIVVLLAAVVISEIVEIALLMKEAKS